MQDVVGVTNNSTAVVVDLTGLGFGASIAAVAYFAPEYWAILFFWLIPFAFGESLRTRKPQQ